MKIRMLKPEEKEAWIKLVELADNRGRNWAEQKFNGYILSKKRN